MLLSQFISWGNSNYGPNFGIFAVSTLLITAFLFSSVILLVFRGYQIYEMIGSWLKYGMMGKKFRDVYRKEKETRDARIAKFVAFYKERIRLDLAEKSQSKNKVELEKRYVRRLETKRMHDRIAYRMENGSTDDKEF